MAIELDQIADSGLERYRGVYDEEWHQHLKGSRKWKIFREMADNEGTIAGWIFLFETWLSQGTWREIAAEHPLGDEAAKFLRECREDMQHTWDDFIIDALSMLVFGFSAFEVVYKIRNGEESQDKRHRSSHDDGMIGWRKLLHIKQETVERWDDDNDDGDLEGLFQTTDNIERGMEVHIPIEKLVHFRTRHNGGHPEGRSLVRSSYPSYYYAKKIRSFEAIGIEKDTTGMPCMTAPMELMVNAGTANESPILTAMRSQMAQIRRGQRMYGIFPPRTDEEGKPTGWEFWTERSPGAHPVDADKVIRRYQRDMAIAVMAEIILLGTEAVGARNLGEVKKSLLGLAMGSISERMVQTINLQLVRPLFKLNEAKFPRECWPTLAMDGIDDMDLDKVGKFMDVLFRNGVSTPDEDTERWARNIAGMPEPEEGSAAARADADAKAMEQMLDRARQMMTGKTPPVVVDDDIPG